MDSTHKGVVMPSLVFFNVTLYNVSKNNRVAVDWGVVTLNSSSPSAAYMRHSIGSALVQIMACRIFGAKPLSKKYACLLSTVPLGTNFSEILTQNSKFLIQGNAFENVFWQNVGHIVPGEMSFKWRCYNDLVVKDLTLNYWWPTILQKRGPHFNIKTIFPRYGDAHVKDKTVTRPSYLYSGALYTGKTTSLYWDCPWCLFRV